MRKYNFLILISWILILGTAGALEMGNISFTECLRQLIILMVLMLVGIIGRVKHESRVHRTYKGTNSSIRKAS